jgi:TetR/AcrR family transcriptional repressor of nem operon
MELFWAKGYKATSLTDLMAATGLHKGSLYQAYGDKHSLFIASLKRYLEDMRKLKNQLLNDAETPLDGLRTVAHGMLDLADADPLCPKGCMAINALVELAPHDPEVKRIMVEHMQLMRASMTDVVTRAQSAGQIGTTWPPEVITGLIMTFMAGLATNLKGAMNLPEAHQLLDAQLASVG